MKGYSQLKVLSTLPTKHLHKDHATHCFIRVTALLEYLHFAMLEIFEGKVKTPPSLPVSAPILVLLIWYSVSIASSNPQGVLLYTGL